ncbi:YraN family protein, partial [Patescibacteria group bacterium]|nr:YraN family protein [Patescibacteria group bacterium]
LIAQHYLTKKKYYIIKSNYFKNHGEIDIIAKKNHYLIFIEVKSRFINNPNLDLGAKSLTEPPQNSISTKKINKLKRTAEIFLSQTKNFDKNCRFDVLSITFNLKSAKIKHIKNAF